MAKMRAWSVAFPVSTCNVTTSSHCYLRHASLRVAQNKAMGAMIKQCEFGKYSCAKVFWVGSSHSRADARATEISRILAFLGFPILRIECLSGHWQGGWMRPRGPINNLWGCGHYFILWSEVRMGRGRMTTTQQVSKATSNNKIKHLLGRYGGGGWREKMLPEMGPGE